MHRLVLILALVVVYTYAAISKTTPEAKICRRLLKPIADKQASKAVLDKCIAAQPGLNATINELTVAAEEAKHHVGCKEVVRGNPARLLKAAGKKNETAKINNCIAKENGHLLVAANGTSTFDIAKFKSEVKAKVMGTSSQAKTWLGLEKCPVTPLVAFDVPKYMRCVRTYCAGSAKA